MNLQQILEALWASEPYKLILSNPVGKQFPYRKMVINRLNREAGWQIEKYTREQVFHENKNTQEIQTYLKAEMETDYRPFSSARLSFRFLIYV